MTNERMIEIMELAIDRLSNSQYRGLCHLANVMEGFGDICLLEKFYFNEYIQDNAPKNNFYGYRWEVYHTAPRIEWLKQQIEILKNQSHATPNPMP